MELLFQPTVVVATNPTGSLINIRKKRMTIQERTEEIYWELETDQNLLVGDYMLLNLKSGHYFLLNLETNTFKEYESATKAIAAIPEKDLKDNSYFNDDDLHNADHDGY